MALAGATSHAWAAESSWKYTARIQPARFDYAEDSNSIASEWDANGARLLMGIEGYDGRALEGGVELGYSTTLTERESWRQGGALRQTNDMDLLALDFLGEIGWALAFDRFTFTPMTGYGFRQIQFSRAQFNVTTPITVRDIVDEHYNIHYFDLGGRVDFKLTEKLSARARASYGHVARSSLSNSATDDIKGHSGSIQKAELGLNYAFSEHFALAVGGFLDLQHLDEKTERGNTWPENDLEIFGITVEGSYSY